MWRVWKAPATWSGMTRALAGGVGAEGLDLLEGAGGDDLAGAVDVGGREAVGLERSQDLVRIAAEHGCHARRGDRAGLRHGAATGGDEGDGLLVRDDSGEGRGRELADRVPGEDGAGAGEVAAASGRGPRR